MVDTTGTTTYTYDDLYRLTDVTYPNADVQSYDYDPMGNRTGKTHNTVPTTYSYDDADQMTLAGGVAYDYDDNGNQLAAGSDTFEWDAENRLIETEIASATGTYEYNGDGLRTTRTTGASAVSYVWDLNASLPVILEDTDGNRYVYGLDLLTRIVGADEEWYLYDGLGSTTGLADDTGAVTGTYEYDVFGAERTHTGGVTEWSFTGEQNDPTGLEYLRARYYDAETGRFLSQDPVPQGNRYEYGFSNPCRWVDPSGMTADEGGWTTACSADFKVRGLAHLLNDREICFARIAWKCLASVPLPKYLGDHILGGKDSVVTLRVDVVFESAGGGHLNGSLSQQDNTELGWEPRDPQTSYSPGSGTLSYRQNFYSTKVRGAEVDAKIDFAIDEHGNGSVSFGRSNPRGAFGLGNLLSVQGKGSCARGG